MRKQTRDSSIEYLQLEYHPDKCKLTCSFNLFVLDWESQHAES